MSDGIRTRDVQIHSLALYQAELRSPPGNTSEAAFLLCNTDRRRASILHLWLCGSAACCFQNSRLGPLTPPLRSPPSPKGASAVVWLFSCWAANVVHNGDCAERLRLSTINDEQSPIGNGKSRHHHSVLAHFAERDFLKFSRALAAHAVAGLERRDVADIAVVSHFV